MHHSLGAQHAHLPTVVLPCLLRKEHTEHHFLQNFPLKTKLQDEKQISWWSMCAAEGCETYANGFLALNWRVSQPGEWSCSVVWWYSSRYFCISCQVATGWTNRLWLGGCCLLVSRFTDISVHWCHWCSVDGTRDVLVGLITWNFKCSSVETWPESCSGNEHSYISKGGGAFSVICRKILCQRSHMNAWR